MDEDRRAKEGNKNGRGIFLEAFAAHVIVPAVCLKLIY